MSKPQSDLDQRRIDDLEARIAALGALVSTTLSTLVLRGVLTRAEIAPLVAEAEALLGPSASDASRSELSSIAGGQSAAIQRALGPAVEEEHDH